MRAQVTIEFLGIFLLTVALFSILIAAMSILKSESEESAWIVKRTIELESIARALDAHSNSGIVMIFNTGQKGLKIENNTISEEQGDKVVVVDGVFNEVKTHREPV
jgi:uncharacterized phosphosugar-binding protein